MNYGCFVTVLFGVPRAIAGRVMVAFATLLCLLAAHSMLETARDAMFLSALPAARLPWVYLAIAALALGAAGLNQVVTRRFSRRSVVSLTLLGSAAVTSLFWFAPAGGVGWIYAFYTWTGLVASISVIQLWTLVSQELDPGQAKRAFAVIGAGGLIGATLGSAVSGAVLQLLELAPRDLILFGAVVLVVAGALPAVAWRSRAPTPSRARRPAPAGPSSPLRHPYLRRLLVLVTVAQMVVTAADLLFKAAVAGSIPAEQLGSFFALFYTALNAVSLLVQLFAAGWLLQHLGVNRALWTLPILIGCSAIGFGLSAGLLPVLLLKLFDGSLRHSLQRTGIELLYLPLPRRLRERHKVTIDAAGARLGQAVASLAIQGGLSLGVPAEHLSFVLLGLVAGLLASVAAIRGPYVELFRRGLHERTVETRIAIPPLDLDSLETLVAGMASDDEAVVLAAMDILAACGRTRLISPLLLHHPSSEVVIRTLSLLRESGRGDFVPLARRLLDEGTPEVRSAALRALGAGGRDAEGLDHLLQDVSVVVRATALVALFDHAPKARVEAALRELLDGPDPAGRVALARAVRARPDPRFVPVLLELAARGESALWQPLARTIAAAPDAAFVPLLLPMLVDRRARPDVRAALVAIGGPALGALERALENPTTPRPVRLHIPRTLSRFASQAAAAVLCRRLEQEPDRAVAYKILRGLGRMIVDDRRLRVDRPLVARILDAELRGSITWLAHRVVLEESGADGPAAVLLRDLLRDREAAGLERVFRMLGLIHPQEDFHAVYAGLTGTDEHRAAYGRELVESLIPFPRRAPILALVARGPDGRERLRRAASFHAPAEGGVEEVLAELQRDVADPVASIAAAAAAELAASGAGGPAVEPFARRGAPRGGAARA